MGGPGQDAEPLTDASSAQHLQLLGTSAQPPAKCWLDPQPQAPGQVAAGPREVHLRELQQPELIYSERDEKCGCCVQGTPHGEGNIPYFLFAYLFVGLQARG